MKIPAPPPATSTTVTKTVLPTTPEVPQMFDVEESVEETKDEVAFTDNNNLYEPSEANANSNVKEIVFSDPK